MLNLVTLADALHPPPATPWLGEAAGAGEEAPAVADGATSPFAVAAHALDAEDGASYVALARQGGGGVVVVKLPPGGGEVRREEE